MKNLLPAALLALVALAPSAVADEIEVIFSEVPGHPTAVVPGAVDLAGNPITVEFKAMEDFTISPDGTMWILKGRNYGGSDVETMLLLGSGSTGSVFAQEGQPVHGGVAGELYDFFDGTARFNSSNDYAYGARARGGDSTVKEKVIRFDGSYSIIAQESDAALGLLDLPPNPTGDELFGNSLNSIHLLDDGTVGFVAVTLQNISSFRRPAIFYDDTSFAQSGVTPIGGDTWDSFDSDGFFTTPDGTTWLARGDDEQSDTNVDDILVVDGNVVIREGSALPGSSRIAAAVFHAKLLPDGSWFARGDDPADEDWAVTNGEVVAETGDPITPGSPESWADVFLGFTGNGNGDWVLAGTTDSGDTATDSVIVLNGRDVVVREGDPVDLDGNGLADDDAFIGRGTDTSSAFTANDLYLTDDRTLWFIAPLRNGAGEDLGTFGTGGDAFLRLRLPSPCSSGNVDLANGNPEDTLRISGSAGGPTRSVSVAPGGAFSLSLDAASAGPAQGRFVVWAWIGEGIAPRDLSAMSQLVGCTVNPTPLNLGLSPQPQFCLPGNGIPSFACTGTNIKNVASFAPWSVNRNNGISNPITITLQGLLQDDSTPHPQGYSVTNAVTLRVEP